MHKYLTDLGYFVTKTKASAAILAGQVKIYHEYITKAPFQINIDKKQISFLSVPLTLGLLSIVSSILNDFDERQSVVEITEKILDNEEYNALLKDEQQTVEELIVCLLSYETGYVRYDYDLENYEKYKSLGKPDLHPLNHLDINYTSNATYKIGIKNAIDIKVFLDCLDPNTDCWFFK